MQRDPWNVALVAYDGLCTFEFGVMVELFGMPRREFKPWYELRVCALERGLLSAAGGIQIQAPHSLRAIDRAGTIIIPGWRRPFDDVPPELKRKLLRAREQGARILSVCSGAFVLAKVGLLDGLRATTHWRYAEELAQEFPQLEVDPDVLYVDEGNILSSAGSAACIDMGLHLIRRDCGSEIANAVARRLVVPPHRDGGQKQYIDAPLGPDREREAFSNGLEKIRKNLRKPHTVASMAHSAHMSMRSFARHFKAATGMTPHRWLIRERIQRSQSLLESSQLPLDTIADRVGFKDAQLLRLHFKRVVGVAPSAYRKTFRTSKSTRRA